MKRALFLRMMTAILLGIAGWRAAAAESLTVDKTYDASKAIPIFMSGYTGEAMAVIKFDLEVAGCKFVEREAAEFVLANGTGGQLEARLTDRARQSRLAKGYSGRTVRIAAHALADDVIQAITGKKGIAQTRIAFKVDKGESSEIYVSDYDGHNPVPLTRDGSIVAAPAWGHGGRTLFYTSYKLGNPNIFSQEIATGSREAVARHPGINSSAAVSPDGRHVAMILSKGGKPEVYVADADGSNVRQVSHTREGASSPCWSPDGRQICYSSRDGGPSALYVISASGGTAQRLRISGVFNATEPDWSPDGTQIAFATQKGGVNFEIYVVPAKGGEAEFKAVGEDPSWAGNSRTIVFAKRRSGGRRGLSLLDVPTKQVKDIAQILGSNSQPAWAR